MATFRRRLGKTSSSPGHRVAPARRWEPSPRGAAIALFALRSRYSYLVVGAWAALRYDVYSEAVAVELEVIPVKDKFRGAVHTIQFRLCTSPKSSLGVAEHVLEFFLGFLRLEHCQHSSLGCVEFVAEDSPDCVSRVAGVNAGFLTSIQYSNNILGLTQMYFLPQYVVHHVVLLDRKVLGLRLLHLHVAHVLDGLQPPMLS